MVVGGAWVYKGSHFSQRKLSQLVLKCFSSTLCWFRLCIILSVQKKKLKQLCVNDAASRFSWTYGSFDDEDHARSIPLRLSYD